jgi:prophage antirepressor-like protein
MSNVIPFDFESNAIRAMEQDGQYWFIAADVCRVLGLSNPTKALLALEKDEYALTTIQGLNRGNDQVNILNESGLYALILKSRKPQAKKFRKWITSEVIPSIRKTGGYAFDETDVKVKHDAFLQSAKIAKAAHGFLKTFITDPNQLAIASAQVGYAGGGVDIIKASNTALIPERQEQLLTPTQLGKLMEPSKSAKEVNQMLESLGFQRSVRDRKNHITWLLTDKGLKYATYQDVGKRHSTGTPIRQIKWDDSILEIINEQVA